MEPFKASVWLWRIITYVLVVSFWCLIMQLSTNKRDATFTDVAFSVLGLQLSQGVPNNVLTNPISNIIFISSIISTFFLTSHYLSNIKASYLIIKTPGKIESLAEAMKDPSIQLIIGRGTHLKSLIDNGTNEVLKEAARRIKNHPENLVEGLTNIPKCLDRVRDQDNMACFSTQSMIKKYIAQNQGHSLYYTKESVTSGLGHWVMRKDFKYKQVFNKEIEKLMEIGKF